jgi:hypothetical protein
MKKKSEKKLQLGGKIKIASLNQAKGSAGNESGACSVIGCHDLSQGAPICSVDSCRF